jgi:hypothetical protein
MWTCEQCGNIGRVDTAVRCGNCYVTRSQEPQATIDRLTKELAEAKNAVGIRQMYEQAASERDAALKERDAAVARAEKAEGRLDAVCETVRARTSVRCPREWVVDSVRGLLDEHCELGWCFSRAVQERDAAVARAEKAETQRDAYKAALERASINLQCAATSIETQNHEDTIWFNLHETLLDFLCCAASEARAALEVK